MQGRRKYLVYKDNFPASLRGGRFRSTYITPRVQGIFEGLFERGFTQRHGDTEEMETCPPSEFSKGRKRPHMKAFLPLEFSP